MFPATLDDILFPILSPATLMRYSRICKAAHDAVSAYIGRTFTIESQLSPFFSPLEIKVFRYWQSRVGMLISGSTALQFFSREVYPDSDLDIYVEHRYCRAIAYWLISVGYSYAPRPHFQNENIETALKENMAYDNVNFFTPPQTSAFFDSTSMGYFGRGVANVYNFKKSSYKIQLITSFHSPLEVILNFHSTCVMNVITHEAAYSFYPFATFEEKRSLIISTEGSKQDTARTKYARRGWTMVEKVSSYDAQIPESSLAQGPRYVGDSRCWRISLLPELDLPNSFVEVNSWKLTYDDNMEGAMSFKILLVKNLRYSYLIVDRALQDYLTPVLLGDGIRLDGDILRLIQWRRQDFS